jgi:hypothetical protein
MEPAPSHDGAGSKNEAGSRKLAAQHSRLVAARLVVAAAPATLCQNYT